MPDENKPDELKQIIGMNSYNDPSFLPKGIVQLIQNMRPDKSSLSTREGWAKYNATVLPSSAGIFGLGIYYPIVGTPLELAVSNGSLYSGASGVFTSRATGLATNKLCSMIQFNDLAIICDQTNPLLVYKYGQTPYNLGIESPKEFKLIEGFENKNDWTVTNGSAADDTTHFIQGYQSVNFTTTTGGSLVAYKAITPAVLTIFPSGGSSTTADYINLFLIRNNATSFTSCTLKLGNTAMTSYFSINLATLADWTGDASPNVAFNLLVRKSAFSSTGTPSWSAIERVQIEIVAAGGQIASIIVDNLRLQKTGPIAADSGGGSGPNGTYWYKVTYVTSDGKESDPGLESDSVTVADNAINLTNLPIATSPRIAGKNIYRTGGTSGLWRLVAVLESPTATTYTDSLADADLGDELVEVEGTPFIPKTITKHDQVVVIGNLTSPDGIAYPCGVMVSNPESPDIYDVDNLFEIEPDIGGSIKWVYDALNFTFVGKEDSIWQFDPYDLTQPPRNITRIYGGVGPLAVTAGDGVGYWLDPTGVISYNGSYCENISDINPTSGRMGSVRNYIEAIPKAYLERCWMLYFNNTLFVGIVAAGGTSPTLILAYYVPTQMWYVISGWAANCGYVVKNATSGAVMHLGSATLGYVYNTFSGDTDDGTDITSILQLPDQDFEVPSRDKDYAQINLFGNKLTATNVTLTIKPYINGVDSGITLDTAYTLFSDLTPKRIEIPMPDLTYFATYLGLKITATKRWQFKGITQIVRLLQQTV